MSLVARHLEENGVPTVIIAAARDIVEHCGVARMVFTDFPLGNPCGQPYDMEMQRAIVAMALDLLEDAKGPRTTVVAPFEWSKGDRWKTLIFSEEQPFLEGEAHDNWIKGKKRYKELRAKGEI